MDTEKIRRCIQNGKAVLGIELGSTRIKAVLIDEDYQPVASGNFEWENQLIDGMWSYSLEEAIHGLQESYRSLCCQVRDKFGLDIVKLGAIGISGMMNGYLVFDQGGNQLTPFFTWRNNVSEKRSEELSDLFNYHVPQRYSIAHLYQRLEDGDDHISRIAYMTTLSGYIHWKLTGKKVLGIDDASGMFPIDAETRDYNGQMLDRFQRLLDEKKAGIRIRDILPRVMTAGENGGRLTEEGARLLDVSGKLEAGIPLCPPEGDGGTGMIATNSVKARTGNLSVGTSSFISIILDKPLKKRYSLIDPLSCPDGKPAINIHASNGTPELDAWAGLFRHFAEKLTGGNVEADRIYQILFSAAEKGDADAGGLLAYGYSAGEAMAQVASGRPLFVRKPDSRFSLENFMKSQLYASLATIRIGLELLKEEDIRLESLAAHGGFFKTRNVGEKTASAAFGIPITSVKTAGEGVAWGIALLSSFMVNRGNQNLEEFLDSVFSSSEVQTVLAGEEEQKGFNVYYRHFVDGLQVERKAESVLQ